MTEPDERLPALNKVIHEPARLAIVTVLSSCDSADFLFLQNITGLSKGNLSVQLSNLELAGIVRVKKGFEGKKTRTTVALTKTGRHEIQTYWKTMDQLRARMSAAGIKYA